MEGTLGLDTTTRLRWGAAMLSVSALMLTACSDDSEDAPAADAPGEETQDAQGDAAETGAAALSEEEIAELLLTEDELPVEVEEFRAEETVSGDEAMPMSGADVETCDELAEAMADPAALEEDTADDDVDTADGYAIIQECEGEAFTQEDEETGTSSEYSFEHLDHGEWEGLALSMATEAAGQSIETELSALTHQNGADTLFITAVGEGQEHLEETADLQLEKYEAGH
ncbi:hypothetical protein ACFP47_03490 [Nesterenkonia lacusekhoensis]|uniref:DUF305 domain-containing protein n=1 Tax=Nesterenkonia lacusekhoensis TaxID=150832 RepID=A0ABS4T430_9MICC|nr:hypothetical protein [Nesterenkonia lacusekhoensis]MBP2318623.1 hypothetical protein [Nesterenkonia lacusekhoensis]